MYNLDDEVQVKSFGKIYPKEGKNIRLPYIHQKKAMENLSLINNSESSYSTLIVLPTGAGKTYTATMWLLKNAIDKNKKVLWIAHRKMLLDQAAESFQKYSYRENLPNLDFFTFRIISGDDKHDRTIDIKKDDNIIIASKDSLGRNLKYLDKWLKGEDEIFLVVDEAHHSTAKTYRKIIDYLKSHVKNLKLIGLTATPFRTSEAEQGLLGRIYSDGIKNSMVVKGDIGISYQIGLKELINRQILAKPVFKECCTDEKYGQALGVKALKNINNLDILPADIVENMAKSAARNKLIVNTYKDKMDEYGQTILFALNINQAIHLTEIFKKNGIKADYIVSSIQDKMTGVRLKEENDRKIQQYKDKKLNVLINVNILTEGIDLPQTKTVFLTRPTISSILMTQMIGRALRGKSAGGTDKAYIISFVDQWKDHIAWVNPETLFEGNNDFKETEEDKEKGQLRMIAISKIQEFASILDDSIDTSELEKVPFEERIPVGMYSFSYLEKNGMDHFCQIMVYNSTQKAYKNFMDSLSDLFKSFGQNEEYPSEKDLKIMEKHARDTFFCKEMIPPYESEDIINALKYYAQKEIAPQFYTFDKIDRQKLNVKNIAEKIWKEDMGPRSQAKYLNKIWEDEDENLLKIFFSRKLYFIKQVDIELFKLAHPDEVYKEKDKNNVFYGKKKLEDLTLNQIGKIDKNIEAKLRDITFEKAMTKEGYKCQNCGFVSKNKVYFHVDHIKPMNRGGKTKEENLQILCQSCNKIKGDR